MPNVPVLSKNSVTSVNCDLTEYPQRLPPRLQKGQTVIIPDTHGNYLLFARHLLESGAATLGMCDYERLARLYYKKGKHTQDELKERQQIINQLKFVEGINVLLIGDYDGDRAEDDGPNYGIINKMRQSKVNVQMCLSNHGIVALALWVGLIEDKVKYKLAYRKIASMRELKKLNYIEYAQQNETPVLFYVENEKTYHLYSKAEKMLSGSGGYAKDIGWGLRDVTNINTVFNELQFTDNLQLTENAPEKVRLALAGCRLHNLYYPVINVRPDQHNSLTGLVDSVIRGDVELDEVKNFVKTHLLPNLIILDYFVDFNASKPQLWTVAHAPVNWARIHKLAEWLNVPYRDAGLLNQCVTLRKIKRAWKDKIDKGDYSFLQKLNDEMQSIIKRGGRIEYPPNDSVLTAFVWSRDPSCGQGQIYGHVGPDDSKYPYGISLDRGELGKYEDIKKGTLYSLTCTKTELNDKFEKLLDNYENLLDKLKEIDENRGDSEAKKIIAKQSRFFISQIEENFEESKLETYEDFFDSILTFLDNKGIDSIYCLPFLVASNSMTMEDYVSFLKDIQHEDLDSKVQNGKEISEEFKTKYSSLGEDIAAFNDCIVKLKYKNYVTIHQNLVPSPKRH